MNVSIRISLPLIEKSLNQLFEKVIYEGNTQLEAGGQVNIHVRKTAPIQLFPQGAEVRANVSVLIKARMQRDDPSLIHILRGLSNLEKIKLEIRFQLATKLTVAKNWKLVPETRMTYSWEKKPTVGIGLGLLKIPVPRIIENILDKELASIERLINDEISAAVALPVVAKDIWTQFFKSILIPSEIPLWLSLTPSNNPIKVGPIRCQQQDLKAVIQLPIEPIARVSAPAASLPRDLPALESTALKSEPSIFPLTGWVSYQELAEISKGKVFPVGKDGSMELQSMQFECRTSGQLHVFATVSGHIPIGGRMVKIVGECEIEAAFTSGSQTVDAGITVHSFKWQTAQWWNRMGTWMMNARLKTHLAEAFNQWLQSEVSLAEMAIRQELVNYKIDEYSVLKGKLSIFYLQKILVKEDELELRFHVEMNLGVEITAFQLPTLNR